MKKAEFTILYELTCSLSHQESNNSLPLVHLLQVHPSSTSAVEALRHYAALRVRVVEARPMVLRPLAPVRVQDVLPVQFIAELPQSAHMPRRLGVVVDLRFRVEEERVVLDAERQLRR